MTHASQTVLLTALSMHVFQQLLHNSQCFIMPLLSCEQPL
jgi:hypothetical protein